jgi:hypothetical protein
LYERSGLDAVNLLNVAQLARASQSAGLWRDSGGTKIPLPISQAICRPTAGPLAANCLPADFVVKNFMSNQGRWSNHHAMWRMIHRPVDGDCAVGNHDSEQFAARLYKGYIKRRKRRIKNVNRENFCCTRFGERLRLKMPCLWEIALGFQSPSEFTCLVRIHSPWFLVASPLNTSTPKPFNKNIRTWPVSIPAIRLKAPEAVLWPLQGELSNEQHTY